MKITAQLLRSRASKPLHSLEFLDLSSLSIERIEKLAACSKLRTLLLSNNDIDYVSNLHVCPQLWKLDLSNNCIKGLEGLSRFVAFGTLILANNQITWPELTKIRHLHILDLSLHGNPNLEQDPYYRIHVIDCLPNVWMLDGRVVTSAERLQVQHFFQDSALTDHPVRHKFAKDHFTTTQMKNISVSGVFGEKTTHLMRRFPVIGALNVDTDKRRLKYLAYNLQEDLKLECKYVSRDNKVISGSGTFLEDVLSIRQHDREKANMLLLLLVASLEFAIPIHLMKETLETTKLSLAVNVQTMDLFLLPRDSRCSIVSLLISAVKIDKDMGEEGGLYDKLYLCLYHSVAELNKLSQSSGKSTRKVDKKAQAIYADSRSLIGAEVVQLLCIVPAFFDYVTKDPGVMHLATAATCDAGIVDRCRRMMLKMEKEMREPQDIYEEVADVILSAIQENAVNMLNRSKASTPSNVDLLLNLQKKPISRRPQSSPILTAEFHAAGRTSPQRRSTPPGRRSTQLQNPQPRLGDQVLLGPQTVARIISIPEADIVLVQMDCIPAETGAMVSNSRNPEEHYTYLDMRELYWDHLANYWRPHGTVGDRISIQRVEAEDTARPAQGGPQPPPLTPSSSPPRPSSPRTAATTPGLPHLAESKEDLPRAVSVQLKERLNLKLNMSREGFPASAGEKRDNSNQEDLKKKTNKSASATESSLHEVALPSVPPPTVTVTPANDGAAEVSGDGAAPAASASAAAAAPAAGAPTTGRSADDSAVISIDIPQVAHESESLGDVSSRSTAGGASVAAGASDAGRPASDAFRLISARSKNGLARDSSHKGSLNSPNKMGMRPMSAAGPVGYRMILARDPNYVSPYQTQRTEAWKTSRLSQPSASATSSTAVSPQRSAAAAAAQSRPSSPTSVVSSPEDGSGGGSSSHRSAVRVTRGNSWLAGGRDLHWESLVGRPRTAHTPGWKEGMMSARPKSAAAFRALKRNKSPAIVTPSSMAYDFAFGRGAQQTVPDLVVTDYVPPPMQHSVRSTESLQLNCMDTPLPDRGIMGCRRTCPQMYTSLHKGRPTRPGSLCSSCLGKQAMMPPLLGAGSVASEPTDHHHTTTTTTPTTNPPAATTPSQLVGIGLLRAELPPANPGPSAATSCSASSTEGETHQQVITIPVVESAPHPVFVSIEALKNGSPVAGV